MKYPSGDTIRVGDRIEYNGQSGCVALVGDMNGACCGVRQLRSLGQEEIYILFDNRARLVLDETEEDELLVLVARQEDEHTEDGREESVS